MARESMYGLQSAYREGSFKSPWWAEPCTEGSVSIGQDLNLGFFVYPSSLREK